jgi:hypothetical protein
MLQAKADIVSAFCIIFGLDLADAKFRAFVSIFGSGVQHVRRRLKIHKYGSVEHEVELQLDGSFKQVGVVLDMSGHHVSQFNLAKSKLAECVRRVKPRMASSESKWLSLERSVYETLHILLSLCHGRYNNTESWM